MIIVDLNILIYAVNSSAANHARVADWWNSAVGGEEPVGLPWTVLNGFLRLTTRGGILQRPLPVDTALRLVDDWLRIDNILVPRETPHHWTILKRILAETGAGGNLVTDAHLAALAIGHGAILATCDSDFARFVGLRWLSPLRS
ncbi:MAG: type II toxin-antitoxin system VapC family toxin [Hyphomicrobiaceae bacterium]|nr:MAG: type II toxin-antitoxin system VapC family toxin [Hyphomicrobiaceae bacterium]